MGWSIGYDDNWNRDIGYGVPAVCDHPGCSAEIDRGLSYVCGGEPYGGEHGCGLYFCHAHLWVTERRPQRCERCSKYRKPFLARPDCRKWIEWKLTDESWRQWREEHPEAVAEMRTAVGMALAPVETRTMTVPLPEGGAVTITYPEHITASSVEMLADMLMTQAIRQKTADGTATGGETKCAR